MWLCLMFDLVWFAVCLLTRLDCCILCLSCRRLCFVIVVLVRVGVVCCVWFGEQSLCLLLVLLGWLLCLFCAGWFACWVYGWFD